VSLAVQKDTISATGQISSGPTVREAVRLTAPPKGLPGSCGRSAPTAYLGIAPEQQQDWDFPVHVTVHTQDIGGPSAGLAMTLGIIDKLSTGRLTGNHVVAATGTGYQGFNAQTATWRLPRSAPKDSEKLTITLSQPLTQQANARGTITWQTPHPRNGGTDPLPVNIAGAPI